jgi:hypothetical protein
MILHRGTWKKEVTDPIKALHFLPWTEIYTIWEKRYGIYFIFLGNDYTNPKYIGESHIGKYALGYRITQHFDVEELIREFTYECPFTVSFYQMPNSNQREIDAITSLEKQLRECEPVPFGNISLRKRLDEEYGVECKKLPSREMNELVELLRANAQEKNYKRIVG